MARELRTLGVETTQVTLSRDIRELNLAKTPDGYREILPDGSYRRVTPKPGQALLRSQERFLEIAVQNSTRRLSDGPVQLTPPVVARPTRRSRRKRQQT
jgi:arginine repressor